jgi:5-methyltetrahydrofolate--homocysteine methyltransferase
MSELLGKMAESLIAGKIDEVVNLTKEALDGGAAPADILDQGLLGGMDVVGQRFQAEEIGADGYASNAASAVDKGKELMGS